MAKRTPSMNRNIDVLAGAQLLGSLAFGLVLTVAATSLLVLTQDDGIAGLGQAAIIIGASILTLPIAWLTDRFGRRIGLGSAYICATLGALLLAVSFSAGQWVPMIVGLLLCGGGTVAGLAIRFAATETAKTKADVPRFMALVMWTATIGSVLGPNLAGPLSSWFGDNYFTGAYLVIAGIIALAATVVLVFYRNEPRETGPGASAKPDAPEATTRKRGPSLATQLRLIRSNKRIAIGIVVSAFGHAVMVGLMAMAPVTMHHYDATAEYIGFAMSLHLGAMYVFSPLVGEFVSRFGADRISLLGLSVLFTSAIALALSGGGSYWWMVIGLILLGLGWSCTMIAGSTMVTQAADPEVKVAIQGATDLSINVLGGLASLGAGLLVNAAGYTVLGVSAGGLIALVTFGLFMAGMRLRTQ